MTSFLWTLIAIQIVMGVFDTFYHHELTERLAWRPSQRYELQLHSLRNMMYAFLFLVLGWLEVHGIFAMLVIAVLVAEIVITLMDFVEEDMSRKLPASERINSSTYSSFWRAFQPLKRTRQSSPGVSQTANVSAKSSSGWLCAYQSSRCITKLRLYG